jgi:serine/threonine-protein kinase
MVRIHEMLLDGAAAACLCAACGGGMDGAAQSAQGTCASGICVSTVAGSGEFGTTDGMAMAAQFFMPHALAMDAMAQLHVADFGSNNGTRLVADGQVSTLAEDAIEFPQPGDRATDAAGNTFVADTFGNRILETTPGGTATVLAGTGQAGDRDGDAATATFSMPSGLLFDAHGALVIADMGNRKIRRITFAGAQP